MKASICSVLVLISAFSSVSAFAQTPNIRCFTSDNRAALVVDNFQGSHRNDGNLSARIQVSSKDGLVEVCDAFVEPLVLKGESSSSSGLNGNLFIECKPHRLDSSHVNSVVLRKMATRLYYAEFNGVKDQRIGDFNFGLSDKIGLTCTSYGLSVLR